MGVIFQSGMAIGAVPGFSNYGMTRSWLLATEDFGCQPAWDNGVMNFIPWYLGGCFGTDDLFGIINNGSPNFAIYINGTDSTGTDQSTFLSQAIGQVGTMTFTQGGSSITIGFDETTFYTNTYGSVGGIYYEADTGVTAPYVVGGTGTFYGFNNAGHGTNSTGGSGEQYFAQPSNTQLLTISINIGPIVTPTPTVTATPTPTPTLTPTPTPTSTYYYNVSGYSCGVSCSLVGEFNVLSATPLTIGYFYNNPENRGYTFEILSSRSPVSGAYDLTGEIGYVDCESACNTPTPTPTATPTPTPTPTATPTPTPTPTLDPSLFVATLVIPSNNFTINNLPYNPDGTYTGTINWGDGTIDSNTTGATHTYTNAGTYTVIIDGVISDFNMFYYDFAKTYSASNLALSLKSIIQFGTQFSFGSAVAGNYFYGCSVLETIGTDIPLLGITDMNGMFFNTPLFNGSLAGWDTSNVTNMSGMFSGSGFNNGISGWVVSAVTNMAGMFLNSSFNQNLTYWDVSNVNNMSYMFMGNTNFNQSLNNWNVSGVTTMNNMFNGTVFNGNISSWNVSNVVDMTYMFMNNSNFNQNISGWNVSGVTSMDAMFYNDTSFNQDLSNWCVSYFPGKPSEFDYGTTSWTLPKPVWGTCPS